MLYGLFGVIESNNTLLYKKKYHNSFISAVVFLLYIYLSFFYIHLLSRAFTRKIKIIFFLWLYEDEKRSDLLIEGPIWSRKKI